MHHRNRIATALALCAAGAAAPLAASAPAASASATASATVIPKLLSCTGKAVTKPASFIISCADANSELTKTRWTTWGTTRATGITTFGLNLCNPYCAASKISMFPASTVVLSDPKTTKHGRLYSELVVTYKLHGKTHHFSLSWSGDPSF